MLEFLIRSVPDRWIVAKPVELTAPFSIFALPSMNIVPFTLNTLVVAFQVKSPPTV